MSTRKLLISLFVFTCLLSSLGTKYSGAHADEIKKECEALLPIAVKNFVHESFLAPHSYELKTYNDVLCENPENMVNVVIVVTVSDTKKQYGVFHLHYNHNGSIPRAPASFIDESTWTTFTNDNGWRAVWCDLIRFVYPDERSIHNCPSSNN